MSKEENLRGMEPEGDAEQRDLETELVRLEEIVAALSKEDLPLEDALRLYEDGVRRVRECQSTIEGVEKRMQVLCEDGSLEDFDDV